MTRARSRLRRTFVVLGAVAFPAALFAIGYVVTGAGAATAPTTPTDPNAAPATDGLSAQRAFYAKLPDRIGIVGPDGKPIGWADKAALTPPSVTGTFDPATENAFHDKLVPVQDGAGRLIGTTSTGTVSSTVRPPRARPSTATHCARSAPPPH